MKPLNALLAFAIFILPLVPARAGSDHGNPGDITVQEFSVTAADIYIRLKLLPASELAGIDMNRLYGAINNVILMSRDTLVDEFRGNEVPALNSPEKNTILINRRMWAPLRATEETVARYTLVLHEFLFFVGIDDKEFHRSNSLIAMIRPQDFKFNAGRIWNPINPVNKISTDLVYNPGNCSLKGFAFDTQAQEEDKEEATAGDCGEAYRSVKVRKASFQAPPSSGYKGLFHRFDISVADGTGKELGQAIIEPEWARCLLPEEGGCAVSGKFFVGGVEFKLWFTR
ncbi:MAG: hypothetical protein EOP11_09500 [Proteobacteria bacterium]|nr:MAG: hypothetical protein EOP11_09500 [Pseudomonadota bacterium]